MIRMTMTSAAALLATTGLGHAVGLDRSNQDIGLVFEDGNYAELSFGRVTPDVTGSDNANPYNPGGYSYDNVGSQFTQLGFGVKMDVSPTMSFALIYDQPFGVDIAYAGAPNTYLGGTFATLDSAAITAVGRYRFSEALSLHAGLRSESISAEVGLGGAAYSNPDPGTGGNPLDPTDGLNGYNVVLDESRAVGYLFGAAYERPDIALRLAVTYHSSMSHEFETTETLDGIPVNLIIPSLGATSTTTVETPQAINIDFQTGVAADTLLTAGLRYAWYSETLVSPVFFDLAQDGAIDGDSLTSIDDSYALSLGVARRFTDNFAASVTVGYEPAGDDNLVSPLSPTDGNYSLALGGQYDMDKIRISGGVRYTWLGDAQPETGGTGRATFNDNTALAIGMSVGYRF